MVSECPARTCAAPCARRPCAAGSRVRSQLSSRPSSRRSPKPDQRAASSPSVSLARMCEAGRHDGAGGTVARRGARDRARNSPRPARCRRPSALRPWRPAGGPCRGRAARRSTGRIGQSRGSSRRGRATSRNRRRRPWWVSPRSGRPEAASNTKVWKLVPSPRTRCSAVVAAWPGGGVVKIGRGRSPDAPTAAAPGSASCRR